MSTFAAFSYFSFNIHCLDEVVQAKYNHASIYVSPSNASLRLIPQPYPYTRLATVSLSLSLVGWCCPPGRNEFGNQVLSWGYLTIYTKCARQTEEYSSRNAIKTWSISTVLSSLGFHEMILFCVIFQLQNFLFAPLYFLSLPYDCFIVHSLFFVHVVFCYFFF